MKHVNLILFFGSLSIHEFNGFNFATENGLINSNSIFEKKSLFYFFFSLFSWEKKTHAGFSSRSIDINLIINYTIIIAWPPSYGKITHFAGSFLE